MVRTHRFVWYGPSDKVIYVLVVVLAVVNQHPYATSDIVRV